MDIKEAFREFRKNYDEESKNAIWQDHSARFSHFWKEKIMPGKNSLYEAEIDEMVRILDKHGKGNTGTDEAVGRVMVPQGAWRRMFNHFVQQKELRLAMNSAMYATDSKSRAKAIDELYRYNDKNKNNLTGATASAINAFLAVANPVENLSIVSLKDRIKIMAFLSIEEPHGFDEMSHGQQVVESNRAIFDYFRKNSISSNARTISLFFYDTNILSLWRDESSKIENESTETELKGTMVAETTPTYSEADFVFYMESHLEDFLIENWDKTELAKKYELVEENGELVSQQYNTDIGKIDILAKEIGTDTYVVIELKKNQTSDDTVGQVARYMGWIDEHRAKSATTKGIIIANKFDERLHYALKKVPNVQVFIYKVNFQLYAHGQ